MTAAIPAEANTHRLSISGMSCAGCVSTVENALKNVPGVIESTVNFAEHTATVRGNVEAGKLIEAVTASGYAAAELRGLEDESEKEAAELTHYRSLLRKFIVAGVVGLPLMLAEPLGLMPMLDTPSWSVVPEREHPTTKIGSGALGRITFQYQPRAS